MFSQPDRVKLASDVSLTLTFHSSSPLSSLLFPSTPTREDILYLSELFICSNFNVEFEDILIDPATPIDTAYRMYARPSSVAKCPRCWKKVSSVDNPYCDQSICPQVEEI